jgi:hypothetical protein
MTFDLLSQQFVQFTTELTNALIVASLPLINDVARKMDLPVSLPITRESIDHCVPSADIRPVFVGGYIILTNEFRFAVHNGVVNGFGSPNHDPLGNDKLHLAILRDKNPTNAPYISEQEAIVLAKSALPKMGFSLEDAFAVYDGRIDLRLPPDPELPALFYKVVWGRVLSSGSAVSFHVDAQRNKLIGFDFSKRYQIPPNTNWMTLPPGRTNWNGELLFRSNDYGNNLAYAEALVPIVFTAIDEYAAKLDLPVPRPLTTNHVARFQFSDNGGWPDVHVDLTNGARFIYRNTVVNGYYGPDCIWEDDFKYWPVKKLFGPWRMTEDEAIELAKKTVLQAGYPTNTLYLHEKPEVKKPNTPGGPDIPRYYIQWKHYPVPDKEFTAWTRVEVNADKKAVESVYHDAKVFWGKKPPIDLPMTLPEKRRIEPFRIPEE